MVLLHKEAEQGVGSHLVLVALFGTRSFQSMNPPPLPKGLVVAHAPRNADGSLTEVAPPLLRALDEDLHFWELVPRDSRAGPDAWEEDLDKNQYKKTELMKKQDLGEDPLPKTAANTQPAPANPGGLVHYRERPERDAPCRAVPKHYPETFRALGFRLRTCRAYIFARLEIHSAGT